MATITAKILDIEGPAGEFHVGQVFQFDSTLLGKQAPVNPSPNSEHLQKYPYIPHDQREPRQKPTVAEMHAQMAAQPK